MKELEHKPKIEKHEEANKQQEVRFLGPTRKPHAGMTLYQYNMETGWLHPAETINQMVYNPATKKMEKREKLEIDKSCYYFWALNEKSAARKLYKLGLIESLTPNN